ncbi:hypothetical protein [Orenia marismortui]|uniref:hypothetical protein n=1 Tax=Orenia marismortui TaxID=46469 RepID=UPI000366C73D|nr:hypothetical protein [Orenia marismortui]
MNYLKQKLIEVWKAMGNLPPEAFGGHVVNLTDKQNLLDRLAEWLYSLIVGMSEFFQEIILSTPTAFLNSKGFIRIYGQIKLISWAVLALVLMHIVYLTLHEDYKVDYEDLVKRLFFFPIVVEIAPHLMVKLIIFYNKIIETVVDTQSLLVPEKARFSTILALIFFVVIFIWQYSKRIFEYFQRIVLLLFFSVIIPIVLALRCSPSYADVGNWLFNKINEIMLIQVAHALVMTLVGAIIFTVSEVSFWWTLGLQVGSLGVMGKLESIVKEMMNCRTNPYKTYNQTKENTKKGFKHRKKQYKDLKGKYETGKAVHTNTRALFKLYKKIRGKS